MPYIKVNTNKLGEYSSTVKAIQSKVNRIRSSFVLTGNSLDWDVRSSSSINKRISAISDDLSVESRSLGKMADYFSDAKTKYSNMENESGKQRNALPDKDVAVEAKLGGVKWNKPWEYMDFKDFAKDSVKTGATIYSSFRKGLATFDMKKCGDYLHIFGKRKARFTAKLPQGTRVKIGSEKYIKNGYALWYKNATLAQRFKSSFSNFGKDTFASKGSIISYILIAKDTYKNLVGNIESGASNAKIAADVTTDIAKGIGSMAVTSVGAKTGAAIGAAIGSIFPGPGTVIGGLVGSVVGGAVAGFAYDYLIDGGLQIGGKSVAGWVSYGLEKVLDNPVGDAIAGAAKSVAQGVTKAVDAVKDVGKSVGNALKSAGKSVKNFFGKLFG